MSGPLVQPEPGRPERITAPPTVLRTGSVRPRRSPHWMLDQLPVGMLDSDFFTRFVSIFQAVATTLLEDADTVEHLADVTVTPIDFVRWLGSWVGAEVLDESLDERVQRRVVAGTAASLSWRGTSQGLRAYLELVSGGPAEVMDGGGVWRDGQVPEDTAWVQMRVESTGWMSEADFVAVVRDEVPAHVRAELWVAGRRAWSSVTDGPTAVGSTRSAALPAAPDEEQR